MQNCIFCKIIDKQIPSHIVAESADLIVINDIAPKAPIHYLIVPKKHLQDVQALAQADMRLGAEMLVMANKLSQEKQTGDFRLVVNSGHGAGQRVFHLHMHMLAGGPIENF